MRPPLCLPGSPAVSSRDTPCGRRGRSLWEGHPGQHGEGVSRTGAEVQARTPLGSRLHPPAHGAGGQNEAIAVGLGAGGQGGGPGMGSEGPSLQAHGPDRQPA